MSNPIPERAELKERRSLSSIWLIPLIALLIGLWLLYRSIADAGILVTLHMPDAEGITPGKTQVIYKGLPAGKVKSVDINAALDGVVVELELNRQTKPLLNSATDFWIVRPQVSAASISGLETLLSGNYITFREGQGSDRTPKTQFEVLKTPPPLDFAAPGLHISLTSDTLGSLERGSPVYYKQIEVGSVQDYKFSRDGQEVQISLHIDPDYAHLVNSATRFWNAGGFSVEGSLSGIKIRTESLTSLLAGGLSFHTPDDAEAAPVRNGHQFKLYKNFEDAQTGELITIDFPTGSSIIPDQTKVIFEGFEVGTVKDVSINERFDTLTAVVLMDPRTTRGLVTDTQFWLVKPKISLSGISGIDALLQGNYITVKVGSLDNPGQRHFVAVATPPPLSMDAPGLNLLLKTQELGSVSIGSPVLFRQLEVGRVEDYQLANDGQSLLVQIHIEPRFSHLVNQSSRFWNASGVSIQGSLRGKLSLRTESLNSIINGGIAFITPEVGAKPVQNRHRFTLFEDMEHARDTGLPIRIHFNDGHGLSVGAPLRYRGIDIGKVSAIDLAPDLKGVVASVQLERSARALARRDTQFWIVLPQLGLTRSENLDTLLGGPYLTLRPGQGPFQDRFTGRNRPPAHQGTEQGIEITLLSKTRGSLQRGSALYYRQVPIGQVLGVRLGNRADEVEISAQIDSRYRNLIRANTRFWNASGLAIDVGLFKGAEVRTESVEALLAGGIALAVPDEPGPLAKSGTRFYLNDEAHPSWLEWSPQIPLGQRSTTP